jgi:hypothetical protein
VLRGLVGRMKKTPGRALLSQSVRATIGKADGRI